MSETLTHVLVIEHQVQTADQIARLLGFESDIVVVGRASSLEEAASMMQANEVEVILLGSLGDGSGLELGAKLQDVTPHVQVILLSVALSTELMQEAMRAGFADALEKPPDSKALYDAVLRAGAKHRRFKEQTGKLRKIKEEPEPKGPKGTVVAVHAPKGGEGCTTLATNLALKLHSQEKPSVLVDADLGHGDVPLFLNLKERHSVADLLPLDERGDADMIDQVLLQHESGLRVLAAPSVLDEVEVTPAEFVGVMNRLRNLYGWIVVDTGDLMVDPTVQVLREADLILSIITPDIASIRRQRIFFNVLQLMGVPRDGVTLFLNKAESNGGITPARIEENLGFEITAEIGYDRKTVLASINRGEPLALNSKTKPFNKGLLELASKVRELSLRMRELQLEEA